MADFDLLIRGGTVVDGLRTPRFTADVGIAAGRIARIGRIDPSAARQVIDADGLVVAPGFVDLHTHYDSQVYWDPYCTLSGWHGVTTVVIGNCGFGFAPCRPEDRDRAMLTMERNEAVPLACMKAGMSWDWESFPEFLDSLERTPKGLNMLAYVGLNPLLMYVMGVEDAKRRGATPSERDQMCRLLDEALEAGACGFSAQLLGDTSVQRDYDGTPMITDTMAEEDLLAFADVLGRRRAGFIQVAGGPFGLTEQLAERSGCPVIFNVLATGVDQHGAPSIGHEYVMRWMERANASGRRIFGQAVTCQIGFTFTLEDWNLFDSSEAWRDVTLGTPAEREAKMRDPQRRARLRAEHDAGHGPTAGGGTEDANPVGNQGIEALFVGSVENPELRGAEGRSVGEIAAESGAHPVDAMLDLALRDGLRTTFETPPRTYDMDAMREIANFAFSLPGVSDGGAHIKFSTLGAYPTEFLSELVRDAELMSLEDAHWRLSAYPAHAAGVRDRGYLREGAPADVVVYDFDGLAMLPPEIARDFPGGEWRRIRKARGYRATIVNGAATFEGDDCTGSTPGQLLRHGRAD
jgi:N-acyl-D-aspartate/D-glutamate deacylase